ncbi:MAG: ABC transporter ATP-binding protein, partial [Ruminococcus sp.]
IHHLIEAERKRGKTIFLTTHNMTEAEKLCDHIALLNEGVIVEYGTVNDICKRFYHQRLFNVELNNGEKISIPQNESAADRIFQLLKQNQIATIHSAEPNLETIFLELTGRTLAV